MDASIERIIRRRYRADGIIVSIDPLFSTTGVE